MLVSLLSLRTPDEQGYNTGPKGDGMIPKTIRSVGCLMLFTGVHNFCLSKQATDQAIISQVDSSLHRVIEIQKEIKDIHTFLGVEEDHLYIFDVDTSDMEYRFQKKEPVPFPMPKGIRASFPLSCYDGKPACVVSRDVFDSLNGTIMIFHEFVHCSQFQTCESRLKETMEIARIAATNNDYSWELNHPFPYQDTVFVAEYTSFLDALSRNDHEDIKEYRIRLKRDLKQVDFEYMVWQEWKEGFARLIENKIRSKYGLAPNEYGIDKPYLRITFYYGGAKFIDYLAHVENDLFYDVELLFNRLSQ